MPRSRQGGYRAPANPAPVSGPGALAQRTDGGAGQPIRAATGQAYGDRKAIVNQQQAAPLSSGPATPAAAAAAGAPAAPVANFDVFRPTEAPNEPTTAGAALGPGRAAGSMSGVLDELRALYAQFPNRDLLDAISELASRLS